MSDRRWGWLRQWQTWGWAALGAASLYVVYLLVSGLLTPAAPTQPGDSTMSMHGIVSEGRHGRTYWRFTADSSEISADGFTTTYHRVRDATYYRDGKPVYKLTAAQVLVDSRDQNYTASGGVHIWSTDGDRRDFRTEDAYWNNAAQLLNCTTPTRVVYDGDVLHTSGLSVNLSTGAAEFGNSSLDYVKPSPAPTSTNR